jgi:hypothetical protein
MKAQPYNKKLLCSVDASGEKIGKGYGPEWRENR